jgi:hypothetical protein
MTNLPLVPFKPLPLMEVVKFLGTARYQNQQLYLDYHIIGNYQRLALPQFPLSMTSDAQSRQDNLWQGLCFECFFGVFGQLDYWELNFSLTGAWNLYHFTGYRQGMTKELRINRLDVDFATTETALNLSISLDLQKLNYLLDHRLDLLLAAVLAESAPSHNTNNLSYWALAHRRAEADFHCRDSFVMHLP